jgi:SAM-dependent methyltransferase
MADPDRGQVDTSAAEVYDSLFVPALFGVFAEVVADAARPTKDDAVVDVACGTGALTRVLRARTAGRVVGVDLNPGMLAVARNHGGAITYVEGDAQELGFGDKEFDVATCQFGLMFLPEPGRGVAELTRIAPRGALAVWDSIDRSDGYSALQALLHEELGPDAAASLDAPFAMGRPGALEALFSGAGAQPTVNSVTGTAHFESIDQWVTTEVRGWTLSASVTDERLDQLITVARDRLAPFVDDPGCSFTIGARVATWGPDASGRH